MCFRNLFGGMNADTYKVSTASDTKENKKDEEANKEDDDSIFDLTDLYMIDEL
ncbi:MAG: hypothetical protein ACI37Z_08940 [Candidatus Gastranaerophilaceae bacterium]